MQCMRGTATPLWAEKEFRNLKRLDAAGIPCPKVEILRQHVLVMSFIGKDGWPAPRTGLENLYTGKILSFGPQEM
eukprot:gene58186-biopygen18254